MPLKHGPEASEYRSKFERHTARLWLLLLSLLVACGRDRAAEEVRTDDAVVVLLPREPDQLDPRYVGDAYGLKLSRLIHASLVRIEPHTLEPEPYLAERIEVESAQRYRVLLREGLRFSDGSVLDADDVVATFRALVDPRVRSRYASTYRRIREVRAISPREVLFELESPHATFLTDLEVPVLRAEDALVTDRLPVGAGPYMLVERGHAGLRFAANPHFALGTPGFAKVRFLVVHDENTRALRMLAGAGDLALNALSPLLIPLFERPEFQIRSAPGVGTSYVGVNLENRVLADLRVRMALAHALDRETLIRHKLGGRARIATSWIVPGHWAHAEDTPVWAYDPDRARALLDEAGYAARDGQPRLSFTLRTGSDRFAVSMARALAAMWMRVGIEVEVRPSESATLLADLTKGRFELTFLQVPEVFEPHVLSWFFSSDHVPQPGVREGANRWRLRDPELDRLLELGRTTVVRDERVAVYRRVQHLLARSLPVIPLWHDDVVAVTSARLRSYRVPRDGRFGTLVPGAVLE